MKNLFSFLSCLLMAVCLSAQSISPFVRVLSQSPTSMRVAVSFASPTFQAHTTPQGTAYSVSVLGCSPILRRGAPALPKFTMNLATQSQQPIAVRIFSEDNIGNTQHTPILPSKGAISRAVNPDSVPLVFGEIYQKNTTYPQATPFNILPPHAMGGVWGQTIELYPLLYQPQSNILTTYTEIILDITFPQPIQPQPLAKTWRNVLNRHFVNMNMLESAAEYTGVSDAAGNMLIVCPAAYMNVMQPFVAWKNQKGIRTELVDVATIGASAADIRAYVNAYYAAHGLTYLLLVGDYENVPSPMLDNGDGDLGASDNAYAYQVGNDAYMDFFVGRFSAGMLADVQTQVQRTLTYEKTPFAADTAWLHTAIGIASNEGGNGSGNNGQADYQHQNTIKTKLKNYGYTAVYELYDGNHTAASPTADTTSDKAGNPTATQVAARINQGISLMNYTGHGDTDLLVTSNFTNNSVATLTNIHAHPFSIIVGCNAGKFDNGNTCLGEALLRARNAQQQPTGSIAGYLSTILQDWDSPMEAQQEMNRLIVEQGAYSTQHTVGGIGVNGMAAMIDKYNGVGDTMARTWTLFGDPSLQLRSRKPFALMAAHDSVAAFGCTQFAVQCPTNGALISLTQNGAIVATAYANGGNTQLTFPALLDTSALLVTVTAYNGIPYSKSVKVAVPQTAYVVCHAYSLMDSLGTPNGAPNGKADAGDQHIGVSISLWNVGKSASTALKIGLKLNDPFISIDDSNAISAQMAAGTTAQQVAFYVSVKDSVPDMHEVLASVKVEDLQGNSWISPLKIILNAPVPTLVDWRLDEKTAGNGNHAIESGETVYLRLRTRNIGHSADTAISYLTHDGGASISLAVDSLVQPTFAIQQLNAQDFAITVAPNAPAQQAIALQYTLRVGAYTQTATIPLTINPQFEPFDAMAYALTGWDTLGASNAPWFLTNQDVPNAGDGCLRSGNVQNDEYSTLSITVNAVQGDSLYFARRVSSEQGYDFLTVYVDGVSAGAWSGELPWATASVWLPQGTHTIEWAYEKDGVQSDGSDCAWIDDVVLPALTQWLDVRSEHGFQANISLSPNPSAAATLKYTLPQATDVAIEVYDLRGVRVAGVSLANQAAGEHCTSLPTADLPSGMYLVRLHAGATRGTVRWMKQ